MPGNLWKLTKCVLEYKLPGLHVALSKSLGSCSYFGWDLMRAEEADWVHCSLQTAVWPSYCYRLYGFSRTTISASSLVCGLVLQTSITTATQPSRQVGLSGRSDYLADRNIWQVGLSGRSDYLAGLTIWQVGLSGRSDYLAGLTIWQVWLSDRSDYLTDLTIWQIWLWNLMRQQLCGALGTLDTSICCSFLIFHVFQNIIF